MGTRDNDEKLEWGGICITPGAARAAQDHGSPAVTSGGQGAPRRCSRWTLEVEKDEESGEKQEANSRQHYTNALSFCVWLWGWWGFVR